MTSSWTIASLVSPSQITARPDGIFPDCNSECAGSNDERDETQCGPRTTAKFWVICKKNCLSRPPCSNPIARDVPNKHPQTDAAHKTTTRRLHPQSSRLPTAILSSFLSPIGNLTRSPMPIDSSSSNTRNAFHGVQPLATRTGI